MKSKYISYLVLAGVLLVACEEVVTLDLDDQSDVVSIEGLVTNELKNHYVRVTQSIDFYAPGSSTPIDNATVTVGDGTTTYNFIHNPTEDDALDGYYFSETEFEGVVGSTYQMNVTVGGTTYTAEDQLFPVGNIDSLTVELDQDEFEDPDKEGYFYEILFYAKEPQETEDFYLFKFYRNDTILRDSPQDIYFSNDDLLAEEINGVPTAGYYSVGDIGRVEMYSISNAGFIFYNDLINLLQGDGGMFGSPPVNPRTNIRGGAVGFFQASSVVSASILVED